MTDKNQHFVPDILKEATAGEFELLQVLKSVSGGSSCWDDEIFEEDELRDRISAAYMEGLERGRKEAAELRERLAGTVVSVLREINEARDAMLIELERELLELSIAISRKVIGREVASGVAECLRIQIGSCLAQLGKEVPVLVRLNPDDISVVEEMLAEDRKTPSSLKGARLLEDRRIERGGCVVETDKGMLRAVIGEQLENLSTALEREYGRSIAEQMGTTQDHGA